MSVSESRRVASDSGTQTRPKVNVMCCIHKRIHGTTVCKALTIRVKHLESLNSENNAYITMKNMPDLLDE